MLLFVKSGQPMEGFLPSFLPSLLPPSLLDSGNSRTWLVCCSWGGWRELPPSPTPGDSPV